LKILLGSHHFFPSTGGIETVTDLLAREFVTLGQEVRVITQTEGAGAFPFPVVRRSSLAELSRQVRWCDVFLQNNISLRTLWPLLFLRRRLFIIHQTWLGDGSRSLSWPDRLKRAVLRYATNLSISRAIAEKLPCPSITIGNPFDDDIFRDPGNQARSSDLVFVGRLVSDKGVDLLIDSLALLHQSGKPVRLTIVGDGPERQTLEQQTKKLGLSSSIIFVGNKTGSQLADILNAHGILIVPSRWPEPFGIVALEAIACGCVVVGSEEGGLPEAIGPCGLTFPNGDAGALAAVLQELLSNPDRVVGLRQGAREHLARFRRREVARACLQLMGATT
jgi:glycosyltransferase involved in cell wall biosynthesis